MMEANASLRSLEHRLTGQDYQEYVNSLAKAAGVDAVVTSDADRGWMRKRSKLVERSSMSLTAVASGGPTSGVGRASASATSSNRRVPTSRSSCANWFGSGRHGRRWRGLQGPGSALLRAILSIFSLLRALWADTGGTNRQLTAAGT